MSSTELRLAGIGQRIQALIAREVKSRYSGDMIGYAWAYLVPLAWILVIYAIFMLLGRHSPIDTDISSFIVTGILPYLSFRYTINAVIRTRSAYREIIRLSTMSLPLVICAIVVMEYYNSLLIFGFLLTGNFLLFDAFEMADPLGVLWALTLTCGLGAALGFMVVVLSRNSETAVRLTPVLLRPMFYLSGVFYTANELPSALANLLAWNPLLHTIELVRSAQFYGYESNVASSLNPLMWIAGMIGIGVLVRSWRRPAAEEDGR